MSIFKPKIKPKTEKPDSPKKPKEERQKTIENYSAFKPLNIAVLYLSCALSPVGIAGIVPLGIDLKKNLNLKLWNKNILKDQKDLEIVLEQIAERTKEARESDINLLDTVFPITVLDKNCKEYVFGTEKDVEVFKSHLESQQEEYNKKFAKYEIARSRDALNNLLCLFFSCWTATSSVIPLGSLGRPIKEMANREIIPAMEIVGVATTTNNGKLSDMYAGGNAALQTASNKTIETIAQVFNLSGNGGEKSKIGQSDLPQTFDPNNLPQTEIVKLKGDPNEIKKLPQYFISKDASRFEMVKNKLTGNEEIKYQFVKNPLDNSESTAANFHKERLDNKLVSITVLVDNPNPENLINKIESGEFVPLSFEISLDAKYLFLPSFVNSMKDEKVERDYFKNYILSQQVLDCLEGEIEFLDGKFAIKIKDEKRFELQKMMNPQNQMNNQKLEVRKKEIPQIDLSGTSFQIVNKYSQYISKDFFIGEMSLTNWIVEQSESLGIQIDFGYNNSGVIFSFESDQDRKRVLDLIESNKQEITSETRIFKNSTSVFGQREEFKSIYEKLDRIKEADKSITGRIIYENDGKDTVWPISGKGVNKVDFDGRFAKISPIETSPFILESQREKMDTFNSQFGSQGEVAKKLQERITNPKVLAKIRDWRGRIEALKVYENERNYASREIKQTWNGHFVDTVQVKEIISEMTNYISKGYYGKDDKLNEEIKNAKDTSEIINLIIAAIENGEPITCQPAAFLTQAILQILGIESVGASGFLNGGGGGTIEEISVLTGPEAHAFVAVQIKNASGEMELMIVDSTPSQRESKPTSEMEIGEITTQITTILIKDIPQMIENWLEILTKNPEKLGAGVIAIISFLILMVKTGRLNLEEISQETQKKMLKSAAELEDKITQIQNNQATKEKYPIKNELEKLTPNDELVAFYLLEMTKYDKLANTNIKNHQEINEIKTAFEHVSGQIKLGTGLPNLRNQKHQNRIIQSLLEEKIPNFYDRKAEFVPNEYKLKKSNQTLEKLIKILSSEKSDTFNLENPHQVLAILKSLKKSVEN